MKNTKKVFGLATMFFTVAALAACGGKSGSSKPASGSSKCSHKWTEVAEESVPATCTAEGKKVQKCEKCGEKKETKVSKAAHDYVEDTTKAENPTCEKAGKKVSVCSVCKDVKNEEIEALGHDMVAKADQSGAKTATCIEPGKVLRKCSRCDHEDSVDSEALGHDFDAEKGTAIPATADSIAMTKVECSRGDGVRLMWKAGDTTAATKTELVNKGDVNAEGDPTAPRIVGDDESGYSFWGRPIGNGGVLSANGDATEDAQAEDALASIEGDYFEFKISLAEAIKNYSLVADLKPGNYTSDVFAVGTEADWTKGFKFDEEGNASAIDDFRYVITIDGNKVALNKDTYVAQRAKGGQTNMTRDWYTFPGKYTLDAGNHTIRITMAGGYKHAFFNFGLQKAAEPANFLDPEADHSDVAWKATFVGLEHCKLFEYLNNDYQKEPYQACEERKVNYLWSRSKNGDDKGSYAKDQQENDNGKMKNIAQWNFRIVLDAGYEVVSITPDTMNYNKIKRPEDLGAAFPDSYSVTQVKGNVTFTVVIAPIAA